MRCPACGATDGHDHVGRLWDRPQDIYRCLLCGACYAVASAANSPRPLNQKEREFIRLTAAGFLNKQIASQLGVSVRTVTIRRRAIMDKLEVKTQAELIRKAVELGLCR